MDRLLKNKIRRLTRSGILRIREHILYDQYYRRWGITKYDILLYTFGMLLTMTGLFFILKGIGVL